MAVEMAKEAQAKVDALTERVAALEEGMDKLIVITKKLAERLKALK